MLLDPFLNTLTHLKVQGGFFETKWFIEEIRFFNFKVSDIVNLFLANVPTFNHLKTLEN